MQNTNESIFTESKSSFTEFYFSTKGRTGRQEFFFRGFMGITLLVFFLSFISLLFATTESLSVQNMNYLVVVLGIIIGVSQVMISIKRLHDFNASGWWSILLFIPLVNIIVLMILLFKGSVNSENKYGDKIGLYRQTPMRWVLFVVQFILIIALVMLNGLAKNLNENNQLPFIKEEKLFLMMHNKKMGFIDEDGNWIIKPIYDRAWSFSEGLAKVKIGEQYGFVDKKGNFVIQPIYDYAKPFSEGLATVEINDKYGFIDKKGNFVIQPIYAAAGSFSEGLAGVVIGDKYGFIDRKGNLVIQPIYDLVFLLSSFNEGLAVAGYGKTELGYVKAHGFIDKKGNLVIHPIYDNANSFSEGLASVYINDKYGFIDKKGNFVIQPIYAGVGSFSEGLARVEINRKYGFIDKKGNVVIEPIYDYGTDSFSEGLARVRINEKYGFIDKKGNVVIEPIYDIAKSFSDGLCVVILDKKAFYINKKGEIAVTPKAIL